MFLERGELQEDAHPASIRPGFSAQFSDADLIWRERDIRWVLKV
jgi:hypothetical protein